MEISSDQLSRIVRPAGKIDTITSAELDASLVALIATEEDIILDLSLCTYISSAGIRVLIKTKKQQQKQQKELYLTGLIPGVMQVLEMAGLLNMFAIADSVKQAQETISQKQQNTGISLKTSNAQWQYQVLDNKTHAVFVENKQQLLSFAELGFSVGFGALAEAEAADKGQYGLFVTAANVFAVLPADISLEEEFRIVSDVKRAGIHVAEALSFGNEPSAKLMQSTDGFVTLTEVVEAVLQTSLSHDKSDKVLFMVLTGSLNGSWCTCLCIPGSPGLKDIKASYSLTEVLPSEQNTVTGIMLLHGKPEQSPSHGSLLEFIGQNLTFENINGVTRIDSNMQLQSVTGWIFAVRHIVDGIEHRLGMEYDAGITLEPYKAFLTRQLYTDSAKVIVHALHGGYSAQTFNVVSFDSEGRKMRPTVLKVAHKNLISREAERCRNYALPYIFNNSAVVLGSEYIGNTGALRYNFVGIGGESSSLKWLTHYYHDWDFDKLEPLFDKIFMQILKPWYGQPVLKKIMLYKDHDPTSTFFAHIYDTVADLLGISADDKMINMPEFIEPVLNPYWFLKHEYKERGNLTMEYYSGVCHGDLNMQNILLDDTMNVYLIDFSETRPRSVISDFARLEAIFLVDNAPVEDEDDMRDYLDFIVQFYTIATLDQLPEIAYTGKHKQKVEKNARLSVKMRQYALTSAMGMTDIKPYYIALLEWVLPIVCYSAPLPVRKLSMMVSSIICNKLLKD